MAADTKLLAKSLVKAAYGSPRGSYPTPFLGRLLFKIPDPNHKTRYPKKWVGYEPLGRFRNLKSSTIKAKAAGPECCATPEVREGFRF